eukprot:6173752-Pleurochrysis_carterae.AAC.3
MPCLEQQGHHRAGSTVATSPLQAELLPCCPLLLMQSAWQLVRHHLGGADHAHYSSIAGAFLCRHWAEEAELT